MIIGRSFTGKKELTIGRFSLSYSPSFLQNIEIFKTQFVYGHREILLDYMSLNYSHLFLGMLQHGFLPTHEDCDAKTPRVEGLFKRSPLWVFSQDRARYFRLSGSRNVIAIGAPWLYLPEVTNSKEYSLTDEKYIVFPAHTNFSIKAPDNSQIRKKIQLWKTLAGNGSLTICLYWSDFLEPGWQQIAREEDVNLTLAGLGGLSPVWSQHPTRINFLYSVRELMLNHTHAIFETFTSPLFYAISSNLNVGYFPEILTQEELGRGEVRDGHDWISSNFPEIVGQFVDSKTLMERSNNMLGVNVKRSPLELKEILAPQEGMVPW